MRCLGGISIQLNNIAYVVSWGVYEAHIPYNCLTSQLIMLLNFYSYRRNGEFSTQPELPVWASGRCMGGKIPSPQNLEWLSNCSAEIMTAQWPEYSLSHWGGRMERSSWQQIFHPHIHPLFTVQRTTHLMCGVGLVPLWGESLLLLEEEAGFPPWNMKGRASYMGCVVHFCIDGSYCGLCRLYLSETSTTWH